MSLLLNNNDGHLLFSRIQWHLANAIAIINTVHLPNPKLVHAFAFEQSMA